MKYHHLFWDFDGTLYDSYPRICAAMNRTLVQHGMSAVSADELMPLLKHSVFYTLQHFAERYHKDVQALLDDFHKQHKLETVFPPYEGLAQCLASLKEAGCKHYLYTHRDTLAITLLQQDGLWEHFTGSVTSCDGFPHKPAPDALLSLLNQFQIDPQDAIMIGDRGIDIESGHNAGMAGMVFDPEGAYFGPEAQLYAASMKELAKKLTES
ncbi:MAG: HAD family hydrolase [Clostridiales bacterium]|nr:HAD family hydrolase [Clostridiales bacterium]